MFSAAKHHELRVLIKRDDLELIKRLAGPDSSNIMNGHPFLTIKGTDTVWPIYKSRFVVQVHLDGKEYIMVHSSSTVQTAFFRLLVTDTPIRGYYLWSFDVPQAYLQST